MNDDAKVKSGPDFHGSVWGQSLAGLIAFFGGSAGIWILGLMSDARVPIWWYLIGIGIATVLVTIFYRPWRGAIWGNLARWRPFTTVGMIDRAKLAGRVEHQEELAAKASRPIPRAQWFITTHRTERFTWIIANVANGTVARFVEVIADPSEFSPGSGMDWEHLDGNPDMNDKEHARTGTFRGAPTEGGRLYGIDFTVRWTDANDQRQHTVIRHQPSIL